MDDLHSPKSDALRALYWRSEILQVMFWLQGEGFGDFVDAPMIEQFLGVDANIGVSYLALLVQEGYLVRDGDIFSLSERGRQEGATEFAASFSDLTRPTHGECSADCWCHSSAEEASACATQRAGHDHAGPDAGHEH